MRDTEFLFRGLALAHNLDNFSGSLSNFINNFCLQAQRYSDAQAEAATRELMSFVNLFAGQPEGIFTRGTGNKFSGVLFESFFAAWIRQNRPTINPVQLVREIGDVKNSQEFAKTLQEGSTKPINIETRVGLAELAIERLR